MLFHHLLGISFSDTRATEKENIERKVSAAIMLPAVKIHPSKSVALDETDESMDFITLSLSNVGSRYSCLIGAVVRELSPCSGIVAYLSTQTAEPPLLFVEATLPCPKHYW